MKKALTTILLILLFIFSFSPIVHAQMSSNLIPATPAETQAIATQMKNSTCPDPIKNLVLDPSGNLRPGVTFYFQGTFIVAQQQPIAGGAQTPVALTCASANNLQKIIIRFVMIIFAILGLVLAISIAKSSIGIMTAFDDSDKFQTNLQGLIKESLYTVAALFAYPMLVFIAVGVLGVGQTNPTRPEYNLFCQNQIIFNLAFDQSQPCP